MPACLPACLFPPALPHRLPALPCALPTRHLAPEQMSNDVRILLPTMVAIMLAKFVADSATHSLYHGLLEVKCVPFLPKEVSGHPAGGANGDACCCCRRRRRCCCEVLFRGGGRSGAWLLCRGRWAGLVGVWGLVALVVVVSCCCRTPFLLKVVRRADAWLSAPPGSLPHCRPCCTARHPHVSRSGGGAVRDARARGDAARADAAGGRQVGAAACGRRGGSLSWQAGRLAGLGAGYAARAASAPQLAGVCLARGRLPACRRAQQGHAARPGLACRDVLRKTRHNGFPVVRDTPQVRLLSYFFL